MPTLESRDQGDSEKSARVTSSAIASLYALVWLAGIATFIYVLFIR